MAIARRRWTDRHAHEGRIEGLADRAGVHQTLLPCNSTNATARSEPRRPVTYRGSPQGRSKAWNPSFDPGRKASLLAGNPIANRHNRLRTRTENWPIKMLLVCGRAMPPQRALPMSSGERGAHAKAASQFVSFATMKTGQEPCDNSPMQRLRQARFLARLVLAWFALTIGVAVASPWVQPRSLEWVCSGGGAMKLLVQGDDGSTTIAGGTLDCPLCASLGAPLPMASQAAAAHLPDSLASPRLPTAPAVVATAAPLPARGPPSLQPLLP